MVAKRITRSERIQTINQARAVVVTGPDDIRARFARFLDAQLEWLDELIVPLVTARAPGLLRLYGLGPDTAAARADRSGQLHIARLLGWRQGINSGHRTQVRSLFQ